jgi:hypothetical protein
VFVECDRLGPIQFQFPFGLQIIPSTLRNDKTYVTGYIVTLYFVVMNFVPFTLLAILNTAIYKQVTSHLIVPPVTSDWSNRSGRKRLVDLICKTRGVVIEIGRVNKSND